MKQICIISDSHVNAIKSGWELVRKDHPDCELIYFAAGQQNLGCLEVSSDRLVANEKRVANRLRKTSKGRDGIDGNYDWYVLIGLEFGFHPAISLSATHRVECEAVDERTPISDGCFGCALEDDMRDSLSVQTIVKLHEITNAPIGVVPYPLRARSMNRTVTLRDREAEIRNLAVDAASRLAREYGFRLFLQPEHTLVSPLSTNAMYSRVAGSTDGHMNSLYGKEILNMVLDRSPVGVM